MRLIEIDIAEAALGDLNATVDPLPIVHRSAVPTGGGQMQVHLLVRASDSDAVVDALERRFGTDPEFRAVLVRVEATVPRIEEETPPATDTRAGPKLRFGVSREELYTRVVQGTEVSVTYTVTVVLSTIVAAVGLWRDDLAVIIGAMVIAPLLGPNVALALATTLADQNLTRKALRANVVGVSIALVISLAVGSMFTVDPGVEAIRSRTQVGAADIVLALAAGALAYTTSVPAALIGVMVAVALLPPVVVFGLLIASGQIGPAGGAAALALANVISVNLAGVLTFLWQNVQPRTWWEAARAKDRTRKAIAVWVVLLIVLVLVMRVASG